MFNFGRAWNAVFQHRAGPKGIRGKPVGGLNPKTLAGPDWSYRDTSGVANGIILGKHDGRFDG